MTPLQAPQGVASIALGAACPCCVGGVALRVSLTRVLRERRPRSILLLLADARHLEPLARRLAAQSFGVALALQLERAEPVR